MAKAEVREEVVLVEKTVTLTLTEKEAYVLLYILRNIGGSPTESPRRESENILDAMQPELTGGGDLYRKIADLGRGGSLLFDSSSEW